MDALTAVVPAATVDVDALFSRLYATYDHQLRAHAGRLVRDPDDSAQLVQDAWIKAWLALPRALAQPGEFAARNWLYRIVENTCLDYLRHHQLVRWLPLDALEDLHSLGVRAGAENAVLRLYKEAAPAPETADVTILRAEMEAEVRAVLALLRPQYAQALSLREYGELSYDQIAEHLGTTRSSVKSLLFRARTEFARHWRERGFAPSAAPARRGGR